MTAARVEGGRTDSAESCSSAPPHQHSAARRIVATHPAHSAPAGQGMPQPLRVSGLNRSIHFRPPPPNTIDTTHTAYELTMHTAYNYNVHQQTLTTYDGTTRSAHPAGLVPAG